MEQLPQRQRRGGRNRHSQQHPHTPAEAHPGPAAAHTRDPPAPAHPQPEVMPRHELVEIGGNMTSKMFTSDLAAVLARSSEAGVSRIVVTGTSLHDSHAAVELCTKPPEAVGGVPMPRLWATAGIHPHHASAWNEHTRKEIDKLASNPHVVAVGECGLDFYRMLSTKEQQIVCFREHLEIAVKHRKPVFLHDRNSSEDFGRVLQDVIRGAGASGVRGVVHCFTGSERELDLYLSLGMDIGITGWITDKRRGADVAKLVAKIPPERLLIETDCPYLIPWNAPRNLPHILPRRNEPCLLPYVAQAVADIRGVPLEVIARETTANAMRLFSLV